MPRRKPQGSDAAPGQRSVLVAINSDTGEILIADDLPRMTEEDFTALRWAAMRNRVARRAGKVSQALYVCAACHGALYASRKELAEGNRWFVHETLDPACPFSSRGRLSEEVHRAIIYRGQQEGREHIRIKAFLAQYLQNDALVQHVLQEPVTFGQVLKGEWKRPDVICEFEGRRVVFEIQLSYTFLSEVIKRDDFYRAEGIYIIWMFRAFALQRAVVTDEAFFNRRNVFVLDDEAMQRTETSGQISFTGFHQRPSLQDGKVIDTWESMPISLREVKFPSNGNRPYFFDYDEHRRRVDAELRARVQEGDWRRRREAFINAAVAYHASDGEESARARMDEAIAGLEASTMWHRGFGPIRDHEFLRWHGILSVLLSLRHDRPIGYQVTSTYQVLEAALRQSAAEGRHPYAVVYLRACKAFKPRMSDKHRRWIRDRSHAIKESIVAGETTYEPTERYDEVIAMLFPEMDK